MFVNKRARERYTERRLDTIHPNPGPRDKTEEGKKRRREYRYKKREERRKKKEKVKQHLTIVAWNVQRMSLGTYNKRKAKNIANYSNKHKWDAVLLSEIRSNTNGVEWFGEGGELTVIIHSKRAGILLRGQLLKEWCEDGQKKKQDERVVSIKFKKTVLVATYQPVDVGTNEAEIEEAKGVLKQHKEWAGKDDILLIGGDFNAHVGGGEERGGAAGTFGIRGSNRQGRELLDFCSENGLAHINSFYNHKKRGTWFNNMNKKWYEIDGFLMKQNQRHKNVRKVSTVNETTLSDHKPKMIILNRKWLKRSKDNAEKKRVPHIRWERLKDEEIARQYQNKVEGIIADRNDNEEEAMTMTNWQKIADIVNEAAVEVCGLSEKRIENPWMKDKEEEVDRMRNRIGRAVNTRNEILVRQRNNPGDDLTVYINVARSELKEARKELKRESKRWENEYYEEILTNCENAGERGDAGEVYKNLKLLGKRGFTKAATTTNLTKEEFKEHFEKVSKDRFENSPEDIDKTLEEVVDISNTEKAIEWSDILDTTPGIEEIKEQINKMKHSAPGEDGVRLMYLLKGGPQILYEIVELVKFMFENGAEKWEDALKVGLVIPLHKKGDKNNPNNFRGVVLLAMGSRIVARILADRLRLWAEALDLLDDNQSGFRKDRSTADATQIMIRIHEDTEDLIKRLEGKGEEIEDGEQPMAKLLDLRKTYPRVNKPALWKLLKKYGMRDKCLSVLQNLHETTAYKIKAREGDSESWVPARGLREGCPSSPPLFNIFHQACMRIAKSRRKRKAEDQGIEIGIPYKWVPGSNFPSSSQWEKGNSEAKRIRISEALFADDTTVAGRKKELGEGLRVVKEAMNEFEERNNDEKEEEIVFGREESSKIRMLGSYIGHEEDLKQRLKRAQSAWIKVKNQLKGSKMSKKLQARVVEACVESTLLFDCKIRPWYKKDLKKMQQKMDKIYRYIWSRKTKPPLIQMTEESKNMFDVRKELGVKSVRSKVEKRSLERIGHVMRLEDSSTVKAVTLGWLEDLESHDKRPGRKRKTVLYWRRLIKEAGLDWTEIGALTEDRKEWKRNVRERAKHIDLWEKRGAKRNNEDRGERNKEMERRVTLTCDIDNCGKICLSKSGLVNHKKRIHNVSKEKVMFKCNVCNMSFNSKSSLTNHQRGCGGLEASSNDFKKCDICFIEVTKSNFSRHRRDKHNIRTTVVHTAGNRTNCDSCGGVYSKSNIARHRQTCL